MIAFPQIQLNEEGQMENEYLFVLPVEEIEVGATIPAGVLLPLHCTMMRWFRFGRSDSWEKISKYLGDLPPSRFKGIELVSKKPALFGPDTNVPVHVLEKNKPLLLLHTEILSLLKEADSLPSEIELVGTGWRPHVTSTDKEFLPGTRYVPDKLMLIERNQRGERIARVWWDLTEPS